MTSLSFIGAGNMAEAMIRGLLRGNVFAPGHVVASYGIRTTMCGSGKKYEKCHGTAA